MYVLDIRRIYSLLVNLYIYFTVSENIIRMCNKCKN